MMPAQTTGFSRKALSASQLQELLLVELAIREQAELNEQRAARTLSKPDNYLFDLQSIAEHEGWQVSDTAVDKARASLARHHLLELDNRGQPKQGRAIAALSAEGRARAMELAPKYLGAPLSSWASPDPTFEDIGQIEVPFLGSRFRIGCVAGEEAKAIRFAERFEMDAGEVTKAVATEIDAVRAMLMAGVMAYERLEELEDREELTSEPDQVRSLDQNSLRYFDAMDSLDALIATVRDSNLYREKDPADQERRLAELEAGKTLLKGRFISMNAVKAVLLATIIYLAEKFADAPIGEAAGIAWKALKSLIGLD